MTSVDDRIGVCRGHLNEIWSLQKSCFNYSGNLSYYVDQLIQELRCMYGAPLDDIKKFLFNIVFHANAILKGDKSDRITRFWDVLFNEGLHYKIFNRSTSFVGLTVINENFWLLLRILNHKNLKPNLRDTGSDGNTLLHHLCNLKKTEVNQGDETLYKNCLEKVLKLEAINVNHFNMNKKTPLDLAIENDNNDAIILFNRFKYVFRYSIENHWYKHKKLNNLLGDENNNIALPWPEDGLPLSEFHYWLMKNSPQSKLEKSIQMRALSELKSNKALSTEYLQEACKRKNITGVQLLLDNGADPKDTDEYNDGRSAIDLAKELGHEKILALLIEKSTFKPKHVTVIPEGRPCGNLTINDVDRIKKSLREQILETKGEAPQIESCEYLDGFLSFMCVNEFSLRFLEEFFAGEENNATLRDIESLKKIVFKLPSEEDYKEITLLLEKQNKGLSCSDWLVLKAGQVEDTYQVQFAIDPISVKFLEANKWYVYYNLDRLLVTELVEGKKNVE